MRPTLLLLAILLFSCSPNSAPIASPTASEAPPALGFWRATLGESGGVTGGGGSVEIWSDGSVFSHRWDTAGSAKLSEYQGQYSPAQLGALTEALTRASKVKHQEYSNMTTSVSWQGSEQSFRHDWAWPESSAPGELAGLAPLFHQQPASEGASPEGASRADIFVAIDGLFSLTLSRPGAENLLFKSEARFEGVQSLKGRTLKSADGTTIEVTAADWGWLEGQLKSGESSSKVRIPHWVEVAP